MLKLLTKETARRLLVAENHRRAAIEDFTTLVLIAQAEALEWAARRVESSTTRLSFLQEAIRLREEAE